MQKKKPETASGGSALLQIFDFKRLLQKIFSKDQQREGKEGTNVITLCRIGEKKLYGPANVWGGRYFPKRKNRP